MKENTFRGKRKRDSEWTYGSLALVLEGAFIWDQRMHQILEKDLVFEKLNDMLQAVIPETVGQFTEYITEDGDKLFEGDIVKRTCNEKTVQFSNCKYLCEAWEIGVVRYNKKYTRFEVNVIKQQDLWYGILPHAGNIRGYNWKIIGNVTDNPEMLKNTRYKKRGKA